MGGGGGRPLFRPRDLEQLAQTARDFLAQATPPARRNVFISFAMEDENEVNLLRAQEANESSDLEFNDRSLQEPFDSDRADYIKRGIRERIRQASVTLVYLSDSTPNSEWVNWEIRESIRLGKGVIATYSGNSPPRALPTAISEFGIRVIPWTHAGLMAAIEDAAEHRGS